MKSKNNQKKNASKINSHKLVLLVALLAQFLTLVALVFYAHFTEQELRALASSKSGTLIINGVDSLHKDTNIDPQNGNVYIYEARLVLPPAPDFSQRLLYNHSPASQAANQRQEVRLIDKFSLDSAKLPILSARNVDQVFDATPKLQSCARGYLVVFAERTETDIPKVFQKQLKDGRTVYVYLEDQCSENKDNMLPYLNQIESY